MRKIDELDLTAANATTHEIHRRFMNTLIERALIIKPEPMEKILRGRKTWEIRTRRTRIRGPIALVEKGAKQIVGVCEIKECVRILTPEDYIKHASKMGLSKKELAIKSEGIARWFCLYDYYAWVLSGVKQFDPPITFANPSGAVTWAKLPPDVSRKVAKSASVLS